MKLSCNECLSTKIIDDIKTGDTICGECGIVFRERLIDFEHEDVRTFSADRSAAGGKQDNARTSVIDGIHGNLTGIKGDRNPNAKTKDIATTLNNVALNTVSYKDKKFNTGRREIGKYCENLNLSGNVENKAHEIWKIFEKKRKKFTRSGDNGMYLAVIYTACKDKNCARTFKELSQITGVNMSLIKQAYKRLDKILKDNMTFSEEMSNTIKRASTGISQIIPRMVENLELPSSMSYKIKQITIKSSPFLEGKRPSTIAAASLLLYLRNSNVESANAITDKDVATAANCHISTLKSAFSVLSVNKDSIFVN